MLQTIKPPSSLHIPLLLSSTPYEAENCPLSSVSIVASSESDFLVVMRILFVRCVFVLLSRASVAAKWIVWIGAEVVLKYGVVVSMIGLRVSLVQPLKAGFVSVMLAASVSHCRLHPSFSIVV
jgi:hypothetical protein